MHNHKQARGWRGRVDNLFVDREFIMRSQGQVRFINIGARLQKIVAAIVLGALIVWGLSLGAMSWSQYRSMAERSSLLERVAEVESSEERISEYRHDIGEVAAGLERRQDFIEEMTKALPEDIRTDDTADDTAGATVSDSDDASGALLDKVSAAIPEAASLARIEARQLAYVERLTRFADRRSARAETAIRTLGLDPGAMMASASRGAMARAMGAQSMGAQPMGGPLERLFTGNDGSIDPRFERLGLSLARMAALERGLQGIPQYSPANAGSITSGFGYRRDPFNGTGAMHSGLDFKGPIGAPIHAAANGKVSFAGWKSGYGKTVEISHGNGLMTRYAHMSRHGARVGQAVEAGDVIGAIGSTGRSTGPHLHFEVRLNERAVNPRRFLEIAPDVLEEARRPAARQRSADDQ